MSKSQRLNKAQAATDASDESTKHVAASRDTALELLNACVATEVRCVAEIVRHVRAQPQACKQLLEHILAIEQGHARQLVSVIQMHQVGA